MPNARHPVAYAVVGGRTVELLSLNVTQSKTKKGDRAHIVLPLALGDPTEGQDGDVPMQVFAGNDGAADSLIFDGYADTPTSHFDKGVLDITGRDKVKKLIDKKSRKDWRNKTPDDIVQELASGAGLSVQSDGISSKAGKIYQIDFVKFLHDVSDWSLINNLSDLFGMNAYVTGGVLYLKNFGESDLQNIDVEYRPPTPESYADGTFIELIASRNLVVANGASVEVKSWNHKQKKVVSSNASSGSGGPKFSHNHPGLMQDQADRIANKKLKENTSHGRTIELDMPGDATVNARTTVTLSGTGTAYDTQYETQTVDHRMSVEQGYRMRITAKLPGQDGGQGQGS